MNDLDELDAHLRDAGRRWRAEMPTLVPVVDSSMFAAGPTQQGLLGGLVLAASIVVVAGAVLAMTIRPLSGSAPTQAASNALAVNSTPPDAASSPPQTPRPSESGNATQTVYEGARVTAIGFVMGIATDALRICIPDGNGLQAGHTPPPVCPPMSVAVKDVDEKTLPEWHAVGQGGQSGYLALTGRWTAGGISVDSATPEPRPNRLAPIQSPCSETFEGVQAVPPNARGEDALRALSTMIEDHGDSYSGYWSAYRDPVARLGPITVVGTTLNPEVARTSLEQIFPFRLCVSLVDYSHDDLAAAFERLGPLNETWDMNIDPALDRIRIRVPFLDESVISRAAPDIGLVVFDPLVTLTP